MNNFNKNINGKILLIATVGRFFTFEKNNIKILQSEGYEVHCATNLEGESIDRMTDIDVIKHQIDFARFPFSKENVKAYKQLCALLESEKFILIHCHTPVGGILGRLAAKKYRKKGTKILYTAHGFHFFKGAPKKNWLLYFPAEWLCSWWTDVLVTINHEDFKRAKQHLHARRTEYVPGVGLDLNKFSFESDRKAVREALGIPFDATIYFSVGELNANKNHSTAIKAFCKAKIPNSYYLICGEGDREKQLLELVDKEKAGGKIKLLGFRKDILELLSGIDVFVFPSYREGLSVALMEAMASGVPCIASNIRGNVDLLGENYEYLFQPDDVEKLSKLMHRMYLSKGQYGTYARTRVEEYSLDNVAKVMKEVYRKSLC